MREEVADCRGGTHTISAASEEKDTACVQCKVSDRGSAELCWSQRWVKLRPRVGVRLWCGTEWVTLPGQVKGQYIFNVNNIIDW